MPSEQEINVKCVDKSDKIRKTNKLVSGFLKIFYADSVLHFSGFMIN